jgi:hypothetical protein
VRRTRAEARGPLDGTIRFCLENKLVVFLLILFVVGWGLRVAQDPVRAHDRPG